MRNVCLVPFPTVVRVVVTEGWHQIGAVAQLGERLLCKQEVVGSIPIGSTIKWSKPIYPLGPQAVPDKRKHENYGDPSFDLWF